MAKRFIDSNLFQKDWFLELESKYQILYVYMFTHCDVAGVFDPNLKTLSKLFNTEYNEQETLTNFKNQLVKVKDKWLLTGFLKHQYGLKISPKMIKPISNALERIGLSLENLDTVLIEYRYSIDTPKEKEIEKEKEKEIEYKEGGMGETEPTETKYFEIYYHQILPVEYLDTWRKYVDHQLETGTKIHQYNVMSHLKAFKECWQNGISPPQLLEAFQQSCNKGLYWIAKQLIKEKEDEKNSAHIRSNKTIGGGKPVGEFDITGDDEYHYETFKQK